MNENALPSLAGFAKNIHSQYGEDGIIAEILRRIAAYTKTDGWCVEFGAWDGIFLSNTYNLIANKGYKAVLIEGNRAKYRELCRNIPAQDVIKLCRFVDFEGDGALDVVLAGTPIPPDFDFLSIDIDGCDYFILKSLERYRPKLVCVEFNPTIPNEVEFVQPRDFSLTQGASPRSLVIQAEEKGYALVAATHCNLFFVRSELKAAVVGSGTVTLDALRDDRECRTFLFSGFDGTILSNNPAITLPWHKIVLGPEDLQQLPKLLRRFPPNYNPLQQLAFELFLALRFPRLFRARFSRKLSKKRK